MAHNVEPPTSVAVVGAGTMGEMYLQAFSQNPDARVVAVCDTDRAKAQRLAAAYGIADGYGDQEAMLVDHGVDAVVVATPDAHHEQPVLSALAHGAHVLCEKPLALDVEACAEMKEAADRHGRRLMVNYGNRHRPEVRMLRAQVEAGTVGPVGYVYLRLNERIEKTRSLSWIRDTNPTWFLHSHLVDLVGYILSDTVREVFGRQYVGRVGRETGERVPDTMIYLLTMSKGTIVTLESSWALPESFPSDVDIEATVMGEAGMLRTPLSGGIQEYAGRHSTLRWDLGARRFDGMRQGWWYDSCSYFIHCLRHDEEPRPNASDGTYVTRVLNAMVTSIADGVPVRIVEG